MRVKQRDESEVEIRRPNDRYHFKASFFNGISEPYAADWLYAIFDEPDSFEVGVNAGIQESWDEVGKCIREALNISDDRERPIHAKVRGSQVVKG